jgi:hypothetical protein
MTKIPIQRHKYNTNKKYFPVVLEKFLIMANAGGDI